MVAQCSALMRESAPLYTARQWLRRWHAAGATAAQTLPRLLADAGMEEKQARPAEHSTRSGRLCAHCFFGSKMSLDATG